MPMFSYKCSSCKHKREHFIYPSGSFERSCPDCGSVEYKRQFSMFRMNVEYSSSDEHMEKVINPAVNEIYAQIGKEALDDDANTLENVFGSQKVANTLVGADD